MKVLITGHRGFVGSAIFDDSNWSGHYGFDILDKKDIRDRDAFEKAVRFHQPDRILHLAAIARFADADDHPQLAFETNALGTKNVVEISSKYRIPMVYASTGSAIMPLDGYAPPFAEDVPARGNSIYGCTKAIGEYYVRQCTAPWIILRYAHLYGPGKRLHGAVSGFLDRMKRGLKPVIYGGHQSNDFISVWDVTCANKLALGASWDGWNHIYHIGTGEELTTAEVFRLIKEMTEYQEEIEIQEQRTVDPNRFVFDCSKAERFLGFKAQYSFKEGLSKMLGEMGYDKTKS